METNKKTDVTRRYDHGLFFPDLLNLDPEAVVLPSEEELQFLGKANIREILKYYRGEERKLRRWIKTTIRERQTLEEKIPKLLKDMTCDWSAWKTPNEPQVFSCRFGRNIAEWCALTPSWGKCGGCCIQSGWSEDNNQHEPVLCQHFTACRKSVWPYRDQACLFARAGAEHLVPKCKEYLAQKTDELSDRLEMTTVYIERLISARNLAADKPIFAEWRNPVTWGKCGDRVVLLARGSYDCVSGIYTGTLNRRCRVNPGPIPHYAWVVSLDSGEITTFDATNMTILSAEDFLYLWEHRDYLELWLSQGTQCLIEPKLAQEKVLEQFDNCKIDLLKLALYTETAVAK